MKKIPIKEFLRLFTHSGWSANYDRRRMNSYELNSRNVVSIAFAGSLLALLLAALSLRAINAPSWNSVKYKDEMFKPVAASDFTLLAAQPISVACPAECDAFMRPRAAFIMRPITNLSALNTPHQEAQSKLTGADNTLPSEETWAKITYQIHPRAFARVKPSDSFAGVMLDAIEYKVAWVNVNGVPWGNYKNSQSLAFALPREFFNHSANPITIEIIFSPRKSGIVFQNNLEHAPLFVSSIEYLQRMEQYDANRKANNGAIVGMMSRVLIAVFALMLFLFIDSAPESLGLALFLGFEALAIGLGQKWISIDLNPLFEHYCYQMGDLFRLYFFLQLARVIKSNTSKWLLYGTILSIPYGIARLMESEWNLAFASEIPKYRDSIVGTIGTLVCIRTLWSIRGQNLPWRRVALILGSLGSAQQVLSPVMSNFPDIYRDESYQAFHVIFESLSVYILALSTFTNISTLENRVQSLSRAKAKSDLIEQELELGRTVQRAFLTAPSLPQDFRLAAHHEAAVYVSGDIYFVYWDEVVQRLVVVLSDVTGHGVQASLKATACYMIARNLWRSREQYNQINADKREQSKLKSYNAQISELLKQFSETADLPTFAGVEIYTRKRQITMYRNNFFSPIIIKPVGMERWELISPVMPAGELLHIDLIPGTIIALFSDGYVDGSRQFSRLAKFITARFPTFDGTPEALKQIFSQYNEQNLSRPHDDRTLVVISWGMREQGIRRLVA